MAVLRNTRSFKTETVMLAEYRTLVLVKFPQEKKIFPFADVSFLSPRMKVGILPMMELVRIVRLTNECEAH